jgi:TIR domain
MRGRPAGIPFSCSSGRCLGQKLYDAVCLPTFSHQCAEPTETLRCRDFLLDSQHACGTVHATKKPLSDAALWPRPRCREQDAELVPMPFLLCCSGCHANLQIPDEASGKLVRCPRCKFVFPAKKPAPPRPPGPAVVEPVDRQRPRRETCVFISHAVADQDFVDTAVHQFFEKHAIDTWYSSHDIAGGANWLQQIMEGLNKSDWFVLVL